MRSASLWLAGVVVLLGALILYVPRLERVDDAFFAWFIEHSQPALPRPNVTVVEISREDFQRMPVPAETEHLRKEGKTKPPHRTLSPLEYALFLQAALAFSPPVIAIEPVLIWRGRDKDQEQVFIDQAMRVPKLLIGIELGEKGERDVAPLPDDLPAFSRVTGRQGGLAEFSGVARQPDDDVRLISTPGFINLPEDRSDAVRVPMLFDCRGEVVPSFPLEAILLWLRLTPADVKVELGREITLPNGWKIPLHEDGTATINPAAGRGVRRLTFGQLLLAAQERESGRPSSINVKDFGNDIVLLRNVDDPRQPPDVMAAAMATIESGAYARHAPWYAGWLAVLGAVAACLFLWKTAKSDFVLLAIAVGSGWCLLALVLVSQRRVWVPTFLPLALIAFLVLVRLVAPAPRRKQR